MGNDVTATVTALVLTLLLFGAVCAGGLLIYHFLVFDNFQGFIEDFSFYQQDEQSAHYLYWFFFWSIVLFSGVMARTSVKTN